MTDDSILDEISDIRILEMWNSSHNVIDLQRFIESREYEIKQKQQEIRRIKFEIKLKSESGNEIFMQKVEERLYKNQRTLVVRAFELVKQRCCETKLLPIVFLDGNSIKRDGIIIPYHCLISFKDVTDNYKLEHYCVKKLLWFLTVFQWHELISDRDGDRRVGLRVMECLI